MCTGTGSFMRRERIIVYFTIVGDVTTDAMSKSVCPTSEKSKLINAASRLDPNDHSVAKLSRFSPQARYRTSPVPQYLHDCHRVDSWNICQHLGYGRPTCALVLGSGGSFNRNHHRLSCSLQKPLRRQAQCASQSARRNPTSPSSPAAHMGEDKRTITTENSHNPRNVEF